MCSQRWSVCVIYVERLDLSVLMRDEYDLNPEVSVPSHGLQMWPECTFSQKVTNYFILILHAEGILCMLQGLKAGMHV